MTDLGNGLQFLILATLNDQRQHMTRRHIYGGTVTPADIAERRRRNRAARASRRTNRRVTSK